MSKGRGNEHIQAAARRAKEVSERRKRQELEDAHNEGRLAGETIMRVRAQGREKGITIGIGIGTLIWAGLLIVVTSVLYFTGVWPNPYWVKAADELPEVHKSVAVWTHDHWMQGYVDENGDFRSSENGELIAGAHLWYDIPERP